MPNRTRDRGVRGKREIVDRRTTPNSDADVSTGSPVGTRFSRNEAINVLYQAFQGRFSRELVSDVLANKRSSVADALESLKALCQNTGPSTSSSQSARQNETHNGRAILHHCCTWSWTFWQKHARPSSGIHAPPGYLNHAIKCLAQYILIACTCLLPKMMAFRPSLGLVLTCNDVTASKAPWKWPMWSPAA